MAELAYIATTPAIPAAVVSLAHTGPYGVVQIAPEPIYQLRDFSTGVLGTGRGRVAGTVKEKGTPNAPVYRKVRLIRERDGLLMRELWSHPVTGAYSFGYIDELQTWTVMSYDHSVPPVRAVVASGLTLANGGVEMIP